MNDALQAGVSFVKAFFCSCILFPTLLSAAAVVNRDMGFSVQQPVGSVLTLRGTAFVFVADPDPTDVPFRFDASREETVLITGSTGPGELRGTVRSGRSRFGGDVFAAAFILGIPQVDGSSIPLIVPFMFGEPLVFTLSASVSGTPHRQHSADAFFFADFTGVFSGGAPVNASLSLIGDTETPEPTTFALGLAGVLAIWFAKRRSGIYRRK
jgi:hypothetical protein